jgi:hypothetical protein
MSLFINLPLMLTQKVSARIIGNKRTYLNAPEEVLSSIKIDRISKLGHIVPSAVLSIVIVIKVLPLLSVYFANQLEENAVIIPFTVILLLIPLLIANGIIIEKSLMGSDENYRTYVKEDPK